MSSSASEVDPSAAIIDLEADRARQNDLSHQLQQLRNEESALLRLIDEAVDDPSGSASATNPQSSGLGSTQANSGPSPLLHQTSENILAAPPQHQQPPPIGPNAAPSNNRTWVYAHPTNTLHPKRDASKHTEPQGLPSCVYTEQETSGDGSNTHCIIRCPFGHQGNAKDRTGEFFRGPRGFQTHCAQAHGQHNVPGTFREFLRVYSSCCRKLRLREIRELERNQRYVARVPCSHTDYERGRPEASSGIKTEDGSDGKQPYAPPQSSAPANAHGKQQTSTGFDRCGASNTRRQRADSGFAEGDELAIEQLMAGVKLAEV